MIAEPDYIAPENDLPMLVDAPPAEVQLRLVIIYTAASLSAKYSIKRGQVVLVDHPISAAWNQEGKVVSCQAKIPFASGRGWEVDFDALFYRGKAFAFFNVTHPASKDQMQLL